MVAINGERLLADLHQLRTFGATGKGVVRPTYSDPDMAAREWLRDRMSDAGLIATIDGAGNVYGRSSNVGPALVIGSHSDTQPEGGWLDGAMGVIDALEVARTLRDDPTTQHLAVDVVAWADEEGTYASCIGSRSFVDGLTDEVLVSTNDTGETVAAALDRCGLRAQPLARFDDARHVGYLEAHIEQGPHLEATAQRIGVVTSIVGIRGCRVSFVGEQNHAGTTPMRLRKDASVAMFQFGAALQENMAAAASPDSVWTTGQITVRPGAPSIVPGSAEVVVQWRDPSEGVLQRMADAVTATARDVGEAGPVAITVSPDRDAIAPTIMDTGLRAHLSEAAERCAPGQWVEMSSAAGHDAMVLAHRLPCAMLFIPSIGGVSHDFAEDSHPDDIVLGCQVLADAAAALLAAKTAPIVG